MDYCVCYNQGRPCAKTPCQRLHMCSWIGCPLGFQKGACKAINHGGDQPKKTTTKEKK